MANSPGVFSTEKDLTFNVQSITSNAAGYVGMFRWGPVLDIVAITTNESELVQRFGQPDKATTGFFHAAANYMQYAVPLNVVRVVSSTAVNAITQAAKTATLAAPKILNDDVYDAADLDNYNFIARYVGDLGNTLKISMANSAGYASWAYKDKFEYAPADANTFNVVVVDENGLISGTAGSILERYELMSFTPGAKKSDGSPAYLKDVIKDQSQWILVGDLTAITLTAGVYTDSFVDGVDGNDPLTASFTAGWDLFLNKDAVDIVRVFTSFNNTAGVIKAIDNMDSRQDSICFNAPQLSDVLNNIDRVDDIGTYFGTTINKPTSYAFNVDNWKLVNDKYLNGTVWIPCDSDAAGLHARTFVQSEPWFSPAGLNRGQLKNVIKMAWSANQPQRDVLYPMSINSIVAFKGEGTVLFGDKTALRAPSAFSRINVRSLFIVIKRAISSAARYQLFELNDYITQSLFRNATDKYLTDVKARRGVYDKRVVCDSSNNTPQVVDANEFVGDIFVKPSKSINTIRLNFVAVSTGVNFEEIEGV